MGLYKPTNPVMMETRLLAIIVLQIVTVTGSWCDGRRRRTKLATMGTQPTVIIARQIARQSPAVVGIGPYKPTKPVMMETRPLVIIVLRIAQQSPAVAVTGRRRRTKLATMGTQPTVITRQIARQSPAVVGIGPYKPTKPVMMETRPLVIIVLRTVEL